MANAAPKSTPVPADHVPAPEGVTFISVNTTTRQARSTSGEVYVLDAKGAWQKAAAPQVQP